LPKAQANIGPSLPWALTRIGTEIGHRDMC
jgi:hypothetical protein